MQSLSWHLWYPRESPPHPELGLNATDLVTLDMPFPFGVAHFPHLPKWGTLSTSSAGSFR